MPLCGPLGDPFVHLHVASGYSLRHGASHPHRLVERAADHGMDTLALTDRDGVYGAVRFAKACVRAGIRPVLGVDLAIEPSGVLPAAAARPRSRTPVRGGATRDAGLPRVTVLAGSKQGWAAVCRLVSATHLRGERGVPVTTLETIAEHASGRDTVVLLGPGSELGRAATARRDDLARAVLARWRDVLDPADLLVEVVSHRVAGSGPGSTVHAARMAALAAGCGLDAVLTNAVRHADASDAAVLDVLDATRRLVPLDLRHLDRRNAEGFLKSGKQMAEVAEEVCRAAGLGEQAARRLLARTQQLGERTALDPHADLGLGSVHLPEFTPSGTEGSTADTLLTRRCGSAARPASPVATARRRRPAPSTGSTTSSPSSTTSASRRTSSPSATSAT